MSGLFARASDESIDLGTGVNFSGGNDGASVVSFFNPISVDDARIIDKSVGAQDNEQTFMLGLTSTSGGSVRGNIDGVAVSGAASIVTDKWNFAAITYDGSNVRCYHGNPATGVLTEVDSAAKAGNVSTDARNCRIGGAGFDTTARPFNGKIADTRIYNEGLTVNELQCILAQFGHDTVFRSLRYRWPIDQRAPGVTIGASQVINVGPIALAAGSGTNTPLWDNHELSYNTNYPA